MTTTGIRLKKIREELRMNQQDFADKIGLTKSAISAVENDKSNLSQTILSRMILDLNINANYILAGIGSPFLTKQDKDDEIKENVRELIKEELKKRGL
jgi:transcriptional regulator with XRE-family HTH domain